VDEVLGREWLNDSSRHTARSAPLLCLVHGCNSVTCSVLCRSVKTACSHTLHHAVAHASAFGPKLTIMMTGTVERLQRYHSVRNLFLTLILTLPKP